MASSHQEKHHHSLPSVAIHIGEHRGRFLQQTQTAEVGFQTSPVRVLEGLPETTSLAQTGGGSRAADRGDSDLSRVEGSNVVASVGQTEDRNVSYPATFPASFSPKPQSCN